MANLLGMLDTISEHEEYSKWCDLVAEDGLRINDVPSKLIDAQLCELAVRQNWRALEFVPKRRRTEELCEQAVAQCGRAFDFVPERFQTLQMRELRWAYWDSL